VVDLQGGLKLIRLSGLMAITTRLADQKRNREKATRAGGSNLSRCFAIFMADVMKP